MQIYRNVKELLTKELRYMELPNRHLVFKSRQWKHKNYVWNLFKVSKHTRKTSIALFIIYFEHILHIVLVLLLLILNK